LRENYNNERISDIRLVKKFAKMLPEFLWALEAQQPTIAVFQTKRGSKPI
jgi:hypothetical protein